MGADYRPNPVWRHQTDVLVSVASAINVWTVVLPFTGVYTRIYHVLAQITVANETLEVEITVNGIVYTGAFACVVGNNHAVCQNRNAATLGGLQLSQVGAAIVLNGFLFEGHNIQVRIRKTTALGAGNVQCKVIHALD